MTERNPQEDDNRTSDACAEEGKDVAREESASTAEKVVLKRQIGLVSGVSIIVGTMIGSGIFISPKGVLGGTGSVGLSLIIWVACGTLSLMAALCYAELGTLVQKSGGEYTYLLEVYGPIPAFLYSWTWIMASGPSSLALQGLTFAEYISEPMFDSCGPPRELKKAMAVASIMTVTFLNCYSVNVATRMQIMLTATKLIALGVIMVGGVVNLCYGKFGTLTEGFKDTVDSPSTVAFSFYSGLWAYGGWSNLNIITEELKNPFKNLPIALAIAVPLVTAVYVLTNVSYFTVMTKFEILDSWAVAVTWGERILGKGVLLIPIAVAFSVFGSMNGSAIGSGRTPFIAAREGHLPEILSYVHVKNYTPFVALLVEGMLGIILTFPADIGGLIRFLGFSSWLFYGAAILSLLIMRKTRKDVPRPYRVPTIIPIIVLMAAIYLVIAPIVQNPKIDYLYAALFIASGLIIYIPFVHFKLLHGFLDKPTIFLQLLLEVSPTAYKSYTRKADKEKQPI